VHVEAYVDFACGWSRTLTETLEAAGVSPRWRPFSLHLRDGPPSGLRREAANRALRVMAALERDDPDRVDAFYKTVMTQGGTKPPWSDLQGALASIGADPSVAEAADDESWDEALEAVIAEARELMGGEVAIPITVIDGVPMSGPLLDAAPSPDDAVKAWAAVVAATQVPGMFGFSVPRPDAPRWVREIAARKR
jgi:hypothetical protein